MLLWMLCVCGWERERAGVCVPGCASRIPSNNLRRVQKREVEAMTKSAAFGPQITHTGAMWTTRERLIIVPLVSFACLR
jgi:hypothetical protein